MAPRRSVRASIKLTDNFERNLAQIHAFLEAAGANPAAFDALLEELTTRVLPNLERFPSMGRTLLSRATGSVEAAQATERVRQQLKALGSTAELRELVLDDHVVLYAHVPERPHGTIILLAICHQRQLSFDFRGHWG